MDSSIITLHPKPCTPSPIVYWFAEEGVLWETAMSRWQAQGGEAQSGYQNLPPSLGRFQGT